MARVIDPAKWELWRQRFQEFEKGGMTVAEFCQQAAVSVATFYQWRRRLEKKGRSSATRSEKALSGVRFVPVEITSSPNIEVHLPNGARVVVPSHDCNAIRTVMATLLDDPRELRSC